MRFHLQNPTMIHLYQYDHLLDHIVHLLVSIPYRMPEPAFHQSYFYRNLFHHQHYIVLKLDCFPYSNHLVQIVI
nr:MAG TPA: hypothetical protein [Caudoviricetes sp.]